MELEQLTYFLKVAELQHMSKAASELNISQSALSANIKKLEYELGVPLFNRHGRRIELNAYGAAFLRDAEAAINTLERAKAHLLEMKSAAENVVCMSMSAFYSFPPLQKAVYQAYPTASVRMVNYPVAEIPERLLSGDLDLCILGPILTNERFMCKKLSDDKMVMILPSSHPAASVREAPLRSFAGDDFVNFSRPSSVGGSDTTDLELYCHQMDFEPHIVFRAANMRDIIESVRSGVGVSLVPQRTLSMMNLEGIVQVEITEPKCITHLRMYWLKDAKERPAVRAVRECIIKYFEERPPWTLDSDTKL